MRRDAARTNVVRRQLGVLVVSACLSLAACGDDSTGTERPDPLDQQLRPLLSGIGITPLTPLPDQPDAQVLLGQALMFDKILSGNRDVSCGTCHDPRAGTSDNLSLSIGTGGSGFLGARVPGPRGRFMARNAPTLMNLGFPQNSVLLFWDGRIARSFANTFTTPAGTALPAGLSTSLAALAMFPVTARDEMRGDIGVTPPGAPHNELADFADNDFTGIWNALMQRLLAIPEYVQLFRNAFPNVPENQLGFQHAANAISAFQIERWTKVNSPFDRYLAGDNGAMSSEAKRGAIIFMSRSCSGCHVGALQSGQTFVNIGVPPIGPGLDPNAPLDHGRERITNLAFERFHFRVPSLRNVELTGPWMHNGAFTSLEAVVRHYSNVQSSINNYDASQLRPDIRATHHGDPATTQAIVSSLDPRVIAPLGFSNEEIAQVVAFLRSLTDPDARNLARDIPTRVPSGLPVE
jgi:cytochrome c peroxidase